MKYRLPQQGHSAEIAATITRLKYRIKRLEDAGDEMAAWLSNPSNLGGGLSMASQWRKAREAKL